LKPGMFVRVRIQFDERENATVVPATSLVKRNGAQGVFLADLSEKKARFVPVTVGITGGGEVEVLDPPISGSIVALGQHLLEDGASIIVTEQTPAGSPPGQEARPALTEGQGAGGKEKP
jgi:multidrug efflux pump subunit AcrA (membrane-fusion protein)